MNTKLLLVLFVFVGSTSCGFHFRENTRRMNALNEMQQTDADFSKRADEIGIRSALKEYLEADGVLLSAGSVPIAGEGAVVGDLPLQDTSYVLRWEPQGADMAASSDLGYTYGVCTITNGDSTQQRTYVTVWRKQSGGGWKIALSSVR